MRRFAGHDRGGTHWGIIASLIETCKLNVVNPQDYLADVLDRLVNGWPMSKIDELMRAYAAGTSERAVSGTPPVAGATAPAAVVSGNACVTSECAETAPLPEPVDAPETKPEHRNAEVDFHGQKRSNATHISTTDAEARLYRKGRGKEARLSYLGHTPDGKPQRPDRRG